MSSYAATFTVPWNMQVADDPKPVPPNPPNSSACRQVFSAVATQLNACGLTTLYSAISDSFGDTSLGTLVNLVTNSGETFGYEIYTFGDTLAGSYPVALKIEYFRTGNLPFLALTVGTGTSGGVLTGTLSPRMVFLGGAYGTADPSMAQTCFISGDAATTSGNARVALAFVDGPTRNTGAFFSVER